MSSFGGIHLDLEEANVDFMISSANKCFEGVPGFAYVIGKKEKLLRCEGWSKSLSMDLVDQYLTLERTGLFRFTVPTHTMLAFKKALEEFELEGGITGRAARLVPFVFRCFGLNAVYPLLVQTNQQWQIS